MATINTPITISDTTISSTFSAVTPHVSTTVRLGQKGKSAYESATDNGFVGTEAEWISSLTVDLSGYDNITEALSSNISILEATTAIFTVELESKVNDVDNKVDRSELASDVGTIIFNGGYF